MKLVYSNSLNNKNAIATAASSCISESMDKPTPTVESLTQEYTNLSADAGSKGFHLKLLEVEIQTLHQQMFKIQRDIAALNEPAPPPAA